MPNRSMFLETVAKSPTPALPRHAFNPLFKLLKAGCSDLDSPCSLPGLDYHIIQHVLESEQKGSRQHALTYFRSDS